MKDKIVILGYLLIMIAGIIIMIETCRTNNCSQKIIALALIIGISLIGIFTTIKNSKSNLKKQSN